MNLVVFSKWSEMSAMGRSTIHTCICAILLLTIGGISHTLTTCVTPRAFRASQFWATNQSATKTRGVISLVTMVPILAWRAESGFCFRSADGESGDEAENMLRWLKEVGRDG